MKSVNQIKAGAIISYINLGLSTLIPFIYTPIMLRMLGESEYGLFSLSHSVINYLSLLSFGFGSTIIRYLSLYRGSGNKQKLQETFGFFVLLYCMIAAVVCLVGVGLSFNVEAIFHRGLTTSEIDRMKVLMLIMTFNSAISFPVSVFSSVIIAHERYVFRKLVDMIATVVVPLSNLVLLYFGFGSVGMAWTSTIIQSVMLPINIIYCFYVLGIYPKFCKMPISLVKEMLGFSLYIFIGTIVDMLFWSTDKVILGMLTGSIAVAVYNIGSTFNSMVINLSSTISGLLTPRITNMVARETDEKEYTNLFIKVGRIQFIIVALIVSGFAVFGQSFVDLWAGPNYHQAYWIAMLTMFPLCVPLIQNTGLSIVIAQNKHKFRSIVYLVIAIVNVISTYLLVPSMGALGASLCSCISYIVGQGIIMNIYYYKEIKIDIPLFWKNILKMSRVPFVMLIVGLVITHYISIESWLIFIIGVLCYSLVYAVGMFYFGLNDYEKEIVIIPILRIVDKVKR